jgi:peptidoglycan/LPS O-acetylase OafA/YrhL
VTSPDVKDKHYLGGLDALRGAACLAVVVAHSWGHFAPETTPTGTAQLLSVGLVVFFAMSGLLIYLPFARDISNGQRRVRLGHYARRRLARVYPAYIVIFLVADLVLRAVYVDNAVDASSTGTDRATGLLSDPVDLLLNLSLLQTFFPGTLQTGINPSWSLTTELCFYALLPLLSLPLVRHARGSSRRALMLALVPAGVLFLVGFAGRAWAEQWYERRPELSTFSAEFGANGIAVLSRSLLGLGDNFAFGMVVAVLFVWMRRGELTWLTHRRVLVIGTVVVLGGGLGGLLLHDVHPWFLGTAMAAASGGLLLLLVEPAARGTDSALVRFASFPPLEYVGRISLSVYLWHYPMIVLASRFDLVGGDSVGTMLWAPTLVSAAALALGSVTYALVERPAMAGRRVVDRDHA